MNPADIWRELESEPAVRGTYRRRVHPEAVADLYLVIHKPDNVRGLLVDVDLSHDELGDLPSGRGIELRWVPKASGQAIELVLSRQADGDLFDALVIDVALAAARGGDERDAASRVAARVRRWQTFLRESSTGLSEERQRGLYGELYLLLRLLAPVLGIEKALAAWTGPSGAPQDFSFGTLAVEAKATIAKQHQHIRIASERQLDTTALNELVLFHLSVDGREGAGETLPDLVDAVRAQTPSAAAAALEDGLFEAGFLDAQRALYRLGYTPRAANLFRVSEGFPCLVEADCPLGVGDVRYSIAVSALAPFAIDAATLRSLLVAASS